MKGPSSVQALIVDVGVDVPVTADGGAGSVGDDVPRKAGVDASVLAGRAADGVEDDGAAAGDGGRGAGEVHGGVETAARGIDGDGAGVVEAVEDGYLLVFIVPPSSILSLPQNQNRR